MSVRDSNLIRASTASCMPRSVVGRALAFMLGNTELGYIDQIEVAVDACLYRD
jgi:hypothetical protein